MTEFLVQWKIDIDAKTPKKAAMEAQKIQRDLKSIATFFEVTNKETREEVTINLEKQMPLNTKEIGCITVPFGKTLCAACGGSHYNSTICKSILKGHDFTLLFKDGSKEVIYAT